MNESQVAILQVGPGDADRIIHQQESATKDTQHQPLKTKSTKVEHGILG